MVSTQLGADLKSSNQFADDFEDFLVSHLRKGPPKNPFLALGWYASALLALGINIATFPATLGGFVMEEALQALAFSTKMALDEGETETALQLGRLMRDGADAGSAYVESLAPMMPLTVMPFNLFMTGARRQAELMVTIATRALHEATKVPKASLRVESSPSGADITIDGAATGLQTPETFPALAPGNRRIGVSRFFPRVDQVGSAHVRAELEPGKRRELTIVIQEPEPLEAPAEPVELTRTRLRVESSPTGANILIDGVDQDLLTPETFQHLPVGKHQVSVSRLDRATGEILSAHTEVDLQPEAPREVRLVLPKPPPPPAAPDAPLLPKLRVETRPSLAAISVDGVPQEILSPHTLEFAGPGEFVVRAARTDTRSGQVLQGEARVRLAEGDRKEILIELV